MSQESGGTEDRVKSVMAMTLTIDPSTINGGLSMDTASSWTSLAQLNLVFALEKEFGVDFEVEEIMIMTSYQDILEIMGKRS